MRKEKITVGVYAPEPYKGGEVAYVKCLIDALAEIPEVDRVIVFSMLEKDLSTNDPKVEIVFERPFFRRFGPPLLYRPLRLFLAFLSATGILNMIPKKKLKVDVLFAPYGSEELLLIRNKYLLNPQDLRHRYSVFKKTKISFGMFDYLLKKVLKGADTIVVDSDFNRRDIMRFYSVPGDKIQVVHSMPDLFAIKKFIEDAKFPRDFDEALLPDTYIFYPANIIKMKNHLNLIKALSIVREKYGINIPLILTGKESILVEDIISEAEKIGVKVIFFGYVSYDSVLYLMQRARVMVFASLFDPYALPIWEAFYLGVPVAASNICGLPEQVGRAGILFDPYSPEDMAEKIFEVWSRDDMRQTFSIEGRSRIEGLNIISYSDELRKILQD